MNKQTFEMIDRLINRGISTDDAWALRRIAMTLHRWHELECGDDHGCIERDEVIVFSTDEMPKKVANGKPYWINANTGKRYPIADRESGALRRLDAIMARYPELQAYVQTDPRGASLYILRKEEITGDLECCYSRGVAVFK